MSWPRGRYNGRRIDGFSFNGQVHLLWWYWLPRFYWDFGQPHIHWLCFTMRARLSYE